MQAAMDWAKARWVQFRRDVWDDASIGPVAGVLLTVLSGLIVWLTIEYAPDAAERRELPYGKAEGGSIQPFWGRLTIFFMTLATLTAGFEPILTKQADRWWRRAGKSWWNALAAPARWILFAPLNLILLPAKLASFAWSLVDYILARPIAILAGAAWHGWAKRYLHFLALMALAVGATIAVEAGSLSPETALAFIIAGLFAILAIVRRWTWIESDRDTFLVERGEREDGRGTLRIGFREDLRDEALTALACLFFLIPLGLDLVQQTTSTAGTPAFAFDSDEPIPSEPLPRFWTWLGYFGAELPKTIPFVDWSEVFHVANGSPIKAQTSLGSQIAFVLRAGLDLLLLAAVLQAVQIATRLREQEIAFRNNRLPILEPFTERVALARAFEHFNDDLDLRPSAQPAILDFPRYDATRLKELIVGTAGTKDPRIRKTAAALLQKDYEAAPDSNPDTPRFWTERAKAETDEGYRGWLLQVASGVDPDEPARTQDAARRDRLLKLVKEDWNDARARSLAVYQLGRAGLSAMERDALLGRLQSDPELSVRAAAAVALAKSGVEEAFPTVETMISLMREDATVPAQALAFALAHRRDAAEEIADRFAASLRPHAREAALIQRTPMDVDGARTADKFTARCETIMIMPGQGPFPNDFLMGSAEHEKDSYEEDTPLRRVSMTRAIALGRFAVTQTGYRTFTSAVGASPRHDNHSSEPYLPVVAVNWMDALAYCRWLSSVTGESWRLPTEAEWEYCCRAGSTTMYSWGPLWDASKSNSNENDPNQRREVGSYQPNEWGFYDMHGNVFEMCQDPWHSNYLNNPPTDQSAWHAGGDFTMRVIRGGSWNTHWKEHRSANRNRNLLTLQSSRTGFRICRTISS